MLYQLKVPIAQHRRAALEITLHVFGVCCPCEREHMTSEREREDHLCWSAVMMPRELADRLTLLDLSIRGE